MYFCSSVVDLITMCMVMVPDEQEILERINRGDEVGLKGLFDLYYKPLCVFAIRFIDSYEEAEDMVQELFVKFWERREGMRFEGSLRSYLFASVRHNCIKVLKSRRKYQFDNIENHEDDLEVKYTPDELEEEREKLYVEIERLPEQCRRVFEAVILKDMKYREAAELLGLSVNTIKTHLARALKQLRNSLNIILFILTRQNN